MNYEFRYKYPVYWSQKDDHYIGCFGNVSEGMHLNSKKKRNYLNKTIETTKNILEIRKNSHK